MRVRITECGGSSQADHYPAYIAQVQGAWYVDGLYFYILGSVGWSLFDLSDWAIDPIGSRPRPRRGGPGPRGPFPI